MMSNTRLYFAIFGLALVTMVAGKQLNDVWETFKKVHEKTYTKQEELYRRKVWEQNVEKIQQHNLEYDLGLHTYTLGLNEYADMSIEEYRKTLLGFIMPKNRRVNVNSLPKKMYRPVAGEPLPDQVDWRKKGWVTPIKNQGACGSCWAFSSTGSLEGQHMRVYGKLVSLSEQNLVDCTQSYGNAGCNGGWQENAYEYIQKNHGIDTEECYPYEAKDNNCRYTTSCVGASDRGYTMVRNGSESDLESATAKLGPIAVAIDASHSSFQLYKDGVYYEPNCSSESSDHAVLVIGYGTDDGDYWLVKNSWGTSWGMDGYIKMSRNRGNNCAIATFATFPIV